MKKEERQKLLQEKLLKMKQYENALYEKGIQYIAGVDEVGRGPLAGPVVSVAVVLPRDFNILGVDDSKKLSPKKREELYEQIKEEAVAYGVGCVDNETIDRINILEATKLAMKDALRELEGKLRDHLGEDWKKLTGDEDRQKPCCIQHVLIDALTLKDVPIEQTAIIHGDETSLSIAAASIFGYFSDVKCRSSLLLVILILTCLGEIHGSVQALFLNQPGVVSFLDQTTFIQNENAVSVARAGEAM